MLLADELVVNDYKQAVDRFKILMADASRELWTCDAQEYTSKQIK